MPLSCTPITIALLVKCSLTRGLGLSGGSPTGMGEVYMQLRPTSFCCTSHSLIQIVWAGLKAGRCTICTQFTLCITQTCSAHSPRMGLLGGSTASLPDLGRGFSAPSHEFGLGCNAACFGMVA